MLASAGRRFLFFLFACSLFTWIGCKSRTETTNSGERRIRVLATTSIIGDLIRVIGGDLVRRDTMMGPGIDPHRYIASAQDLERLEQADLIFFNGLHLEGKLTDILQTMAKRRRVIAVTDRIPTEKLRKSEDDNHEPDPHVWFDVTLWKYAVDRVVEGLCEADPANAAAFRSAGGIYQVQLTALDTEVKTAIAGIPGSKKILITAHDAFGYFGAAYGLNVRGLQGVSTATETSSRDILELAKLIGEKRIPTLFGESSVPDKGIRALQEAVAKQFNFRTELSQSRLFSDALGDPDSPAGSYIGMVKHNVQAIVDGLTNGPRP
jgi:manganese/zinc/iron transport system substrate-binding protein